MAAPLIFGEIPQQAAHTKDLAVFQMRVAAAWDHYLERIGEVALPLKVAVEPTESRADAPSTTDTSSTTSQGEGARPRTTTLDERAKAYQAQKPLFTFDQLVASETVIDQLLLAARTLRLEKRVFDDWGLRKIEPSPRAALNFYGPPGTGKTLAAHALASYLGTDILLASYAQIESMYHGEGPKNVEAVFHAAQRAGALLFIDEADSLLSKRLTQVSQGSEQAINSMRSQLLICLEKFTGVVVFATNLVENYDRAFETRVRNISFPLPDHPARERIWRAHFPPELPLAVDVDAAKLANVDGLCGREIKNAVIDAALQVAMAGRTQVALADLEEAASRVLNSRIQRSGDSTTHALNAEEQAAVRAAVEGTGTG